MEISHRLQSLYQSPDFKLGLGDLFSADLIVINQAKEHDDRDGLFTGKVGEFLKSVLGERLPRVFIANLVPFEIYEDELSERGVRGPNKTEIIQCTPTLLNILSRAREGAVIMPLGTSVFSVFSEEHFDKFTQMVGQEKTCKIRDKNFRLLANLSPYAVFNNPSSIQLFSRTIDKAFSPPKITSASKYLVCNFDQSISALEDTIVHYEKGKIGWTLFDIETNSFSPWGESITYYDGSLRPPGCIMVSLAHDESETAFAIPWEINNFLIGDSSLASIYLAKRFEENAKKFEVEKEELLDWSKDPELVAFKDSTKIPWKLTDRQVGDLRVLVRRLLETVPIVGHNLKFDIKHMIWSNYVNLSKVRVQDDTLVMAHQILGRVFGGSLGLKNISRQLLDVKEDWDVEIENYLSKFRKLKDRHYGNIPTSILGRYAALDSYYNKELYHVLLEKKKPSMEKIMSQVTRSVMTFTEVEVKGIQIDRETLNFLDHSYNETLKRLYAEIKELSVVKRFISKGVKKLETANAKKKKPLTHQEMENACFSLTSLQTLKTLLYSSEYFALPILKDYVTKTGAPQTGKEVIAEFIKRGVSGEALTFLENLRQHKALTKLVTTYINNIPHVVVGDSYKPDFSLTGTVTGRLSSGFHTLPSKSDIKRMFVSRWKEQGGLFLAPDFSQLELRMLATLSGEKTMIEAYRNGIDIHTITGSKIHGNIPLDQVTKEMRQKGKTTNFAVVYGTGAAAYADQVGVDIDTAKKMLKAFFEEYPALRRWIDEQHQFVLKNGFITTPWNRVIPIPEAFSQDRAAQSHAMRAAQNYPSQGGGSDVVLWCINRARDRILEEQMKTILVGTVHDSLEYDVYPGELIKMIRMIKDVCEKEVHEFNEWLTCPLEISLELGTSWGGCAEFSIESMDENSVSLRGKAMRKDIKMLELVASNAYDVSLEVLGETPIDEKSFSVDTVIRDRVNWDVRIKISGKG